MKKSFFFFLLSIWLVSIGTSTLILAKSANKVVLFDAGHGETAGNADWAITKAYSSWADLLKSKGFIVKENKGKINSSSLKDVDVLVLPEPNVDFSKNERKAILEWVKRGGGLFLISDHINSDRNNDGIDSVGILNKLAYKFGFSFNPRILNEAPVNGKRVFEHPLLKWVKNLPCWVGTSIKVKNIEKVQPVYFFSNREPFIVAARYGRGRVIGIGDSSIFDDGTGSPHKRLHKVFASIRFDVPQFAYNSICWLAQLPTEKLPRKKGVDFFSDIKKKFLSGLYVDMTHGNIDVDQLDIFSRDLKNILNIDVIFGDEFPSYSFLQLFAGVMITDPFFPYGKSEILALKEYLRQGGNLLIVGRSIYRENGHPEYLNSILKGIGSQVRIIGDQLLSEKSHKSWVFLVDDLNHYYFKKGAAFWSWSAAPLRILERFRGDILAYSPRDTYLSTKGKKSKNKYPLITYEKIGKGQLIVMGMSTFSNYQYPIRRKEFVSVRLKGKNTDNTIKEITGEFNLAIIKILSRR